jgi:eukaryotic-like serine/threonine-protein kinase
VPILSGKRLGPYEILSSIGAGGMGEVYRARDSKLGRDVAIKVLPEAFARDAERMARFEREAKVLASLNHPNIASIYGMEDSGDTDALVMELVEGPTLADRIKSGPIPIDEALRIAKQITEALEYAHERGIVHRDLKPPNVKVTNDDAVKILDFGLAKALEADSSSLDIANSPTITGMATQAGVLLGTAAYMSPEQAKGKPVDRRADIWAFGCVLYEMLTGKMAFDGETVTDTLVAIIKEEPDWSKLPAGTPARVRVLLQRCLQKDPKQRLRDIGDARISLDEVLSGAEDPSSPATVPVSDSPLRRAFPWAVAATLALVAGGALFLPLHEKQQPRFTNVTFRNGTLQGARFSHDGQTIVYSGSWEDESPQVAVARVGSPESRSLGIPSGTIATISSSDELAVLLGCERVFLIDCGGTLATVSLAGGSPRALAQHVAFADWNPNAKEFVISVFSSAGARLEFPPGHVLCQQRAGWFGHPRFSPDGSMIAYEDHPDVGNDAGALEVVDLNGKRTVLATYEVSLEGLAWSPNGKEVWYAGTKNGGWADTIFAVNLSRKTRAILTMPYLRLHDIAKDGRVLMSHEIWRRQLNGFFPGDKTEHTYSWLDGSDPTAISADGRLISFDEGGETYYLENDFLSYYRSTDGSPPVLLGAGTNAISPDGKWLLATSAKSHKLVLQPIGTGQSKELPTPGLKTFDRQGWSDDGLWVTYEAQTNQSDWNVYVQKLESGPPILVKAGARDAYPILSSDGRMLALHDEQGGISLYPIGSSEPAKATGVLESEYPIRFINGAKSLLVAESTARELVLTIVDLTSGRRESWKRLPAVTNSQVRPFIVTPDLKYYEYSSSRYASDLYIAENLH